jgi:hypothetical protein
MKHSLPKEVEIYLNDSIMFNKFGVANLGHLIMKFKLLLTKEELKRLINEKFGKEFANGIEFI